MNTTDTPRIVRRRPGRRVPLDAGKLRAAITLSGLSIREVARRSDITAAHLAGVLSGKHGIQRKTLRQVTAELGVPYESVLAGPPAEPAVPAK
jgi:transcriptional regulator with XRE-family HTH domain